MAEVLDEVEAFIHAAEICSVPKDAKPEDMADSFGKKDKTDRIPPDPTTPGKYQRSMTPPQQGKKGTSVR